MTRRLDVAGSGRALGPRAGFVPGLSACGALALAFALVLAGCSSCRDGSFAAELLEKRNAVERELARAANDWHAADVGDRFRMGDAVRTGSSGEAILALPRRGRLLVKGDTLVRFVKSYDPSGSGELEVVQGELTIESGEWKHDIRTARGVVRVDAASTVRVFAREDKARFDVEVGRVEYTLHGERKLVAAGSSFELEVLPVSIEEPAPAAPAAAVAAESEPEPKPELAPEPPRPDERFDASPATAIVTFAGGESVTIHDPAPPTDIGVTFDECPDLTVLELARGRGRFGSIRVRGRGEIRARVPAGAYRYRLRCLSDRSISSAAASRGTIKIVTDAATRPLPLAPVTITADADGRRYTVSYQNRLPTITLRWPYAPRASTYYAVLRPAQGAQFRVESARPSVTLAPGRLGDGTHGFWFETADGRRSEQGVLQVSFDFAARTAYLTSPPNRSAAKGGSARVAGGTLLGSKVDVMGAPLPLDAHGRFSATVPVSPEHGGTAVRVRHPTTGIHYYVRHLRF